MILRVRPCPGSVFAAAVIIMSLSLAPPAAAQNFVMDLETNDSGVTPSSQPDPNFPGDTVRKGQEGWVRMSFVVTADGRAIDPIIIDSVGGSGFEREAKAVLPRWQYEPREHESPGALVDLRFEIYRGRDAATSNFIRRYKRIVTHLYHEEAATARELVDAASELGGWNLYESVMLWLMQGRVAGAEGDDTAKLEHYRRALGVSDSQSLFGEDKCELLRKIFELEVQHGQYAAAKETLAHLKRVPGHKDDIEMLAEKITEMQARLDSDEMLVARGTLYNTCDCEDGEPIWNYAPARREFSFANFDEGVDRFEARCRSGRISGMVETDRTWTLPDSWGSCRIYVFGEDGASFDFREHEVKDSNVVTEDAAVARGNVLD